MSTLLNLSGKIDPQTVAVFEITSRVIAELGMPYVIVGALYGDDTQIMERYDWDITQSSAHLLGQYAHSIAQDNTRSEIARFVKGELGEKNPERLIDEMCTQRMDSQYESNRQLLSAFLVGFGSSI